MPIVTIQRNIVGRYAVNTEITCLFAIRIQTKNNIVVMASYRSHPLGLIPLLVLALVISFASAKRIVRVNNKAGINGAQASFPYMYATKNDLNASYPVIEYIAPTTAKKLENDRPDFLYDKNQGYRIVEFVSSAD